MAGGGETDRQTLLAGRQAEPQRNVALAGAGVADRDDILTPLDVFAARKLQNESLVQRRQCREVEAVEAFDSWELGGLDAAFDHAPLTLDQLQLGQLQQIAGIIGALVSALTCQLVV